MDGCREEGRKQGERKEGRIEGGKGRGNEVEI